MRRTLITLALALTGLAAQAADIKLSGNIVEQNRPVTDFQSIRSEGLWSLDVQVGPAPSVKIKTDANLMPLIETSVNKNELLIHFKDSNHISFGSKPTLRIEVTVPKLAAYTHEGAGKTVFHDLVGEKFSINYEGAGVLTATGKVDSVSLQANGAGVIDLKGLKAKQAAVNLEGIGAVNVYASESLAVQVDGLGSLTYYGNPAKISKNVSGIGSVSAGD